MTAPLLLCCDLDRTLLPNGPQDASPEALPRFQRIAARPEVTLAYVTGRSRDLVERAISHWEIPLPDVVAADVGTTIYDVGPNALWAPWYDWQDVIARDWKDHTPADLANALADIDDLTPQAKDRQGPFKLCYTAPHNIDAAALVSVISARLDKLNIATEVIWSVDETRQIGLLDILPRSATKQGAVDFLRCRLGFAPDRTLFAGDSGNDLPVLAGPLKAILVANATHEVRTTLNRLAEASGKDDTLYLAHGDFLGMNGAYAAGILEGLAHFFPETLDWMT
ncbi:MAG: HAD-IIB family hydrolase [Rhodospirillaceae bacterium]|nr:HAD-IIB family hydrolase [Rhodospirillaceae bacterium]